jgi:mono/diheme cytochrome c family protein
VKRARAYLDVHCAVCHTPQGTGYTRIDLRHNAAEKDMFLVDQQAERPRPAHPTGRLIVPGRPEESELLHCVHAKGARQMPPLGRSMVDDDAVALLSRWIKEMPPTSPKK